MKKPILDKTNRDALRLDREYGFESQIETFLNIKKAQRDFIIAVSETGFGKLVLKFAEWLEGIYK